MERNDLNGSVRRYSLCANRPAIQFGAIRLRKRISSMRYVFLTTPARICTYGTIIEFLIRLAEPITVSLLVLWGRYWSCSPRWSQLVRVTVELSPDDVDATGKPSVQAPPACSNFVVQLIAPWFQTASADVEQRRRRYRHASNAYKSCIDK
jgi:hypothetical protein